VLITGGHSGQGCGCERLHHPSTGVQHRLNQCMPCVLHILSPTHTAHYSLSPLPLARLLQWTLLPFCLSLADQPRWNPAYARKCCSCSVFSFLRLGAHRAARLRSRLAPHCLLALVQVNAVCLSSPSCTSTLLYLSTWLRGWLGGVPGIQGLLLSAMFLQTSHHPHNHTITQSQPHDIRTGWTCA
jgi:hypothetical protein